MTDEKKLNEMEQFQRKMKRKRLRRLLRFAFLSLLVIVVVSALVKVFFSVSSVRVINPTPYATADLVNDASLTPGRLIFSISGDRIKKDLGKQYPYVADVSVDIKLPSTVTILFTEGKRSWRLENEGEYLYLTDDMIILEKTDTLYPDTVKVTGMEIGEVAVGDEFGIDDSIEFKVLGDIISALDRHGMRDKLTSVDFSKKYNTKIYLGDRVEVELGTSEAISEKIELMLKILDRNSPEKRLLISVKNPEEGRCRILEDAGSDAPQNPPPSDDSSAGGPESEPGTGGSDDSSDGGWSDDWDDGSSDSSDGGWSDDWDDGSSDSSDSGWTDDWDDGSSDSSDSGWSDDWDDGSSDSSDGGWSDDWDDDQD